MYSTQNFDVIIVGCGPAGSSVALEAAKCGVKVAVIEKESTVAQTVRTSGVTWMQDINEFKIPKDCYNPIRNYSFCSPNNTVTIRGTSPDAAVLDVRKTYRWLARQAEKYGAEIFTGTTVTGVIKDRHGNIAGVKCSSHNEIMTFNSKVVIDASGFSSTVCRAMNLVKRWKKFGAGAEVEAKAENVNVDTWWLMVGQRYSPAGYAWIFPTGKDTVRIGVGVGRPESSVDPAKILQKLINAGEGPIGNLVNITPLEYHYGLIPNDGPTRETVHNNLILVGDAAGHANPLVLEGIRYAIRFGRVAGKVAADAVKKGTTNRNALYPYEERWKKEIQSKIKSAGKVQERWIGLTDEQWDAELDAIKELNSRELLDFIRADFGATRMAKLAVNHPKLAVRQLFSMIKYR